MHTRFFRQLHRKIGVRVAPAPNDGEIPMPKRGRALRRHHAWRTRRRFRGVVEQIWCSRVDHDPAWVESAVRKFAETRKPCSCPGCGNQRKIEGPPVSERRKEWLE
jgi:hypothetical protein